MLRLGPEERHPEEQWGLPRSGDAKVKGAEKAIQLLECCNSGLRRDLQRNSGGVVLSGLPVDDILAAIKVLAVRIENPTVARDNLQSMLQD